MEADFSSLEHTFKANPLKNIVLIRNIFNHEEQSTEKPLHERPLHEKQERSLNKNSQQKEPESIIQ